LALDGAAGLCRNVENPARQTGKIQLTGPPDQRNAFSYRRQ